MCRGREEGSYHVKQKTLGLEETGEEEGHSRDKHRNRRGTFGQGDQWGKGSFDPSYFPTLVESVGSLL